MSFEELNVKPEIVRALNEIGIKEPTGIQEKAIPLIKAGKDVIGASKTGSGKTAAFGVPIIESITPGKGVQALIIAPTRELAVQIAGEMRKFSRYAKCHTAMVYGGVSIEPQITQISRADIVVGTPGRLIDHMQRNTINLSQTKCVVLDEADRMVEMGFIESIRQILDNTPENKQILLFGATISDEINNLKADYMHKPETVQTERQVEQEYLKQYYYTIQPQEKFSLLVHILRKEQMQQAIIFCSKISTVELVARNLRNTGVRAEHMHGKLSQNKRQSIINDFSTGKLNLLVASPVAARGLDIKNVTHVFNYDLSKDPQEYIHRVGRTARAGEKGKAITLLSPNDFDVFGDILNHYRVNIEELPKEEFQKLRFDARAQQGFQRFSGRRSFDNRGEQGRSFSGRHEQNSGRFSDSSSRQPNRRSFRRDGRISPARSWGSR